MALVIATILIALLSSNQILSALLSGNANTRAGGLIQYPHPSRPENNSQNVGPPYQSGRQNFDAGSTPTRLRLILTRNISSRSDSSRLAGPEISYFGTVGLGKPEKLYNVVFDTGSSEVWIPAYNWFPFANNLHYSDGFSCSNSKTCVATKREFTMNYRGTQLSGETVEDAMTLYEDMQTKEDAQILIASQISFPQNFLAIEDASDEQFRYKPYDGVIGLAPIAQSSSGTRNILLSMQIDQQRRALERPAEFPQQQEYPNPSGGGGFYHQEQPFQLVFAFWFNPNQNSRHGGELMIGGVDEERYVGDIFFHRLISHFDWQLPVSMVLMGAEVISCADGCTATLDSGANSIVGPRQDVEMVYSKVQAQYDSDSNLWLLDCSKVNYLPAITINIERTPYVLYPTHYVGMFKWRSSIVCHMAIKPWDNPGWLLGTRFIGAYYTVFDFQNRRVGFATPRQ